MRKVGLFDWLKNNDRFEIEQRMCLIDVSNAISALLRSEGLPAPSIGEHGPEALQKVLYGLLMLKKERDFYKQALEGQEL